MKETSTNVRPFSMKDKIGITLGDLGCCCTEQFRAMFLTVFYTLVLQVNPFHVGILMLVTKIWDAVNDPIIGALVDMACEKRRKIHSMDPRIFVPDGSPLYTRICKCEQSRLRIPYRIYVCDLCAL